MKYVFVVQASEADWPGVGSLAGVDPHGDPAAAFVDDLRSFGELIVDERLAGPEQARLVRANGDRPPMVAAAPFDERREFLARVWIVDCDGPERAVEIAASLSALPGSNGAPANVLVEVRPLMKSVGEEM